MKVKNRDKVIKELEECIEYLNKRTKRTPIKETKKQQPVKNVA